MTPDTDGPTPEESALRSLERTLRRDKLALERLNPLQRPEHYAAALEHVADLEAQRRELRARVRGHRGTAEDDADDRRDETSDDDSD